MQKKKHSDMLLFCCPDLLLKMLVILAVRPIAAPGKAMGDKEFITEIAWTEFVWKITFPVGVGFRAGRGDPDAHAGGSVEVVCICIFIDISYIGIKEGIDVNSHSIGMAG